MIFEYQFRGRDTDHAMLCFKEPQGWISAGSAVTWTAGAEEDADGEVLGSSVEYFRPETPAESVRFTRQEQTWIEPVGADGYAVVYWEGITDPMDFYGLVEYKTVDGWAAASSCPRCSQTVTYRTVAGEDSEATPVCPYHGALLPAVRQALGLPRSIVGFHWNDPESA